VIFQLAFATVGVVVIVTALLLPVRQAGYAGILYSLNGVVGFALGVILGKKERKALERIQARAAAAANL
jgi:hypothetical protein